MEPSTNTVLAIGGIALTAFIGAIVTWLWKRVTESASKADLDKTSAELKENADKIEKALSDRMDRFDSVVSEKLDKFEVTLTGRFERLETDLKTITKDGINSGSEGREKLWKELREQGERIAEINGYLSTIKDKQKR